MRPSAKGQGDFERLKGKDGIELKMINMGGRLPANYIHRTKACGNLRRGKIHPLPQGDLRRTMCQKSSLEPGRSSLIANAGISGQ